MSIKDIENEVIECIGLMIYDIENNTLEETDWNAGRIYGLKMALEIIRGKITEEVY